MFTFTAGPSPGQPVSSTSFVTPSALLVRFLEVATQLQYPDTEYAKEASA